MLKCCNPQLLPFWILRKVKEESPVPLDELNEEIPLQIPAGFPLTMEPLQNPTQNRHHVKQSERQSMMKGYNSKSRYTLLEEETKHGKSSFLVQTPIPQDMLFLN